VPKKQSMVVKSNKLVQASYRLSLIEQQIILFAISKAREEQTLITPNTLMKIRAIDFAEMFSHDETTVYRDLKAAAKRLSKRQLSIKDFDPATGYERGGVTNWVQHADYVPRIAEIQIAFTMKIIPYITRLERDVGYTRYTIEKIGSMTSGHGIRLYELMAQFKTAGTRTMRIAELREMMRLDPNEYKLLANLKRRVIDEGVKQINEHSDLKVSYDQRKAGRQVDALIFTIKVKPGHEPKTKLPAVSDEYISQHANPGETAVAAGKRLREERKAASKLVAGKPARKLPAQDPVQMDLTGVDLPEKHPDDPGIKAARSAALKAAMSKRADS
jgi:plasmid replication initiation protein